MCGDGVRKRVVTCYEKNENDTIVKLEDEQCIAVEDLMRPEDEEKCTADKKCETYNWITTPWAGCSDGEEGEGSPAVCGLGAIFSNSIFIDMASKSYLDCFFEYFHCIFILR